MFQWLKDLMNANPESAPNLSQRRREVHEAFKALIRDQEEEKSYVYVFVRKDIPIWAQIVQVGHVCLEAGRFFHDEFPFRAVNLILLKVESQTDLSYAEKVAANAGARTVKFFEGEEESLGNTSIPSFTALCTEPLDGESWKLIFEDFELWNAEVV